MKSLFHRIPELPLLLGLLAGTNLLATFSPIPLHLTPDAFAPCDLWRWLTFPWLHVSLYHLLLDASAFFLLYTALKCDLVRRLQHLLFCGLFSGLLPLLLDPRIETLGLCGLSGVAHGLMLICGFEAATRKHSRMLGLVMWGSVLGKAVCEQISGIVLFSGQHLGNIGTPIPSCHLGGVLGGLLSFALAYLPELRRKAVTAEQPIRNTPTPIPA